MGTPSLKGKVRQFFEDYPTEWSTKDVAERLGIAHITAKRHVRSLYFEEVIMRTGTYERRTMYMIKD